MFCKWSDRILDVSHAPLFYFAFEKVFRLEKPELGVISSWLDKLLKFQYSANRANVHVACLNPKFFFGSFCEIDT